MLKHILMPGNIMSPRLHNGEEMYADLKGYPEHSVYHCGDQHLHPGLDIDGGGGVTSSCRIHTQCVCAHSMKWHSLEQASLNVGPWSVPGLSQCPVQTAAI